MGLLTSDPLGDRIEVSGTAAWNDDGTVFAPGQAYRQTRAIFAIIERALEELGAGLPDVTRTRVFITPQEDFAEVARAHFEIFGALRPPSSCLGAAHLLHPDLRVEIEASAVMPDGRGPYGAAAGETISACAHPVLVRRG